MIWNKSKAKSDGKPDGATAAAVAVTPPSAIVPPPPPAQTAGAFPQPRPQLVTPIATAPSSGPADGSGDVPPRGGTPPGGGGNGSGPGGPGAPGGSGPFSHAAPEGHAKKVSEVLGEIVWLMSQSPMHKQFFIADLEWPIASAIKEVS